MAGNNYFVLLSIISTSLLLMSSKVVNSDESVKFEFTKFRPNPQNLILQRDAVITSTTGLIELTTESGGGIGKDHSVGRVLYDTPIHLWDSETGALASFQTNFSFVIDAIDQHKTADGLAFFLAPVDTQPSNGELGLLGLFSSAQSTTDQIVAVEFDTFKNTWDPQDDLHHIGIDVASIKSTKTEPWFLENKRLARVSITYDATTTVLAVAFDYPSLPSLVQSPLTDRVDLTDFLPEWVRVGFSASTGNQENLFETHQIHAWSFHSELKDAATSRKAFNKISSVVQTA